MERTAVFTDETLIRKIEACQKEGETFSETVEKLCELALNGFTWGEFGGEE